MIGRIEKMDCTWWLWSSQCRSFAPDTSCWLWQGQYNNYNIMILIHVLIYRTRSCPMKKSLRIIHCLLAVMLQNLVTTWKDMMSFSSLLHALSTGLDNCHCSLLLGLIIQTDYWLRLLGDIGDLWLSCLFILNFCSWFFLLSKIMAKGMKSAG